MLKNLLLMMTMAVVCSCSTHKPTDALPGKRVLVFCGHGPGYVHENIPASAQMILDLAAQNNFSADTSSNPAVFCNDTLNRYDILVFANASNMDQVLDTEQRAAMEHFIKRGGGFIGLHAAVCHAGTWEWFTRMIGGKFDFHPQQQAITLKVVDADHPAVGPLPDSLRLNDELYQFTRLNPKNHVLAVWQHAGVAWGDRTPEGSPRSTPAVWCNQSEGGRSWFSCPGHDPQFYADSLYRAHVLAGLRWVADKPTHKQ